MPKVVQHIEDRARGKLVACVSASSRGHRKCQRRLQACDWLWLSMAVWGIWGFRILAVLCPTSTNTYYYYRRAKYCCNGGQLLCLHSWSIRKWFLHHHVLAHAQNRPGHHESHQDCRTDLNYVSISALRPMSSVCLQHPHSVKQALYPRPPCQTVPDSLLWTRRRVES